ncbi:DUF350 domain-containing protein [Nocardiopsis mangrovi]|uniref:DUF350 domain-containing protein n=1 Tax=Nocardiopsis mangrovi TaxID=1179818 RepID=A0ABV9E4X1_9ACTN
MNLLAELGSCLAYGVVGTLLMAVGYVIVDVLTPGKLHELIWTGRNKNATLIVAANTLGTAMVVFSAIMASESGLVNGLLSTAGYGMIGLVLMAAAFLMLDALTPGKLGSIVAEAELHPAAWVNAAAHVSVALVVAAAIS